MPFYHALVRPDVLPVEQREPLANDVTELHCDVTGAPRTFVHVLFTIDDTGRLPLGVDCLYRANIRHGRDRQQKQEIETRLRRATANRATTSEAGVAVEVSEVEASFVLEGGRLLPEPGTPEEEAWKSLDAHPGTGG